MSARLNSIEPYRNTAPRGTVDFLLRLASRLQGRRFVHVNSTREGGGGVEILNRLVPTMRGLGIKTDWEVIEGDSDFYASTKAFHNALQRPPRDQCAPAHRDAHAAPRGLEASTRRSRSRCTPSTPSSRYIARDAALGGPTRTVIA